MSRWFRFYTSVLDDPKAQMLPPELFKHWVNVLCIAGKYDGELPALSVMAFTLRMSEVKVAGVLAKLHGLGLLDKTETGFKPHNWDGRQYKTDAKDATNAERQKEHRKKKAAEMRELKALLNSNANALRNGALRNAVTDVTAKRPDTESKNITTTASVERKGLGDGEYVGTAEFKNSLRRMQQ